MRDVRRLELGETVRLDASASAVRLGVSGRWTERPDPRRETEVVIERSVLLARDDDVLDRRGRGARGRTKERPVLRQEGPGERRRPRGSRPDQERSPVQRASRSSPSNGISAWTELGILHVRASPRAEPPLGRLLRASSGPYPRRWMRRAERTSAT